ncbi:hypothetical protein HMPREF0765_0805 [Sphingobacterium spiritivorum ATCC 33300]|uniref:Uncharacterized protein n=1 Tax=Sphingobacterium spiritivorum ATCC 33300 TaxID=525372 RepID=C2FU23_SPHSI|nr:hypothetical protein HMPREF0765_0805 [Sphingobacterium spiritivorum ATCC 33300]
MRYVATLIMKVWGAARYYCIRSHRTIIGGQRIYPDVQEEVQMQNQYAQADGLLWSNIRIHTMANSCLYEHVYRSGQYGDVQKFRLRAGLY